MPAEPEFVPNPDLPHPVLALLIRNGPHDLILVSPEVPESLWMELYDLCNSAPPMALPEGGEIRAAGIHLAADAWASPHGTGPSATIDLTGSASTVPDRSS